jgi:hypothetical protein
MKNEVKKKMHAAKRLLVYQSHRETSVDRKSERHSIQTGREQAITGDEEAAAARRDMSIASGPSDRVATQPSHRSSSFSSIAHL